MTLRFALALAIPAMVGSAFADSTTTRTSFDHDWKFARFGAMPDGTRMPEPGAKSAAVSASTEQPGNPASNAIDGNPATRWCAESDAKNQWLQLDLGRKEPIGGVKILWEKKTANPFSVEISDDGRTWKEVSKSRAPGESEDVVDFKATARYVRVNADGATAQWASIRELEVRDSAGKKLDPKAPDAEAELSPAAAAFKDSGWRALDLPHDWAIEGPFRMDIENETGKLPWVGIGWYRKTFDMPDSATARKVFLDFDGAMAQPKVFVNGKLAGEWKYGYSSFRIDISSYIKPGAKNTVAVRVENVPNSTRWYPGGGLYRHVWIVESPQIHIAEWGVYVTTPKATASGATVATETTVDNTTSASATLRVKQEVSDGPKVIATAEANVAVEAGASGTAKSSLEVASPKLWDLKTPFLYSLRTSVYDGEKLIDSHITPFGIRDIHWDAKEGFMLNGKKVVINGVCQHHDLGPLGAAVHTRAMERQIEILQEMGCNAIRTSHNPPAPEFLDLCDRMGVLVMDELFDIWKMQKYGKTNGYNIFWDEWHERDIRSFVMRDRNHASVIGWSTGNEISELSTPSMFHIPQKLHDEIKKYDTTRPVTVGSNRPNASSNGFQKTIDVFGLNYYTNDYTKVQNALPDMPLYASETSSTVSTRGEYFFPVDWDKSKGFYNFQVSSYDLYAPGWASRPDIEFEALDSHPRFAGEFVWTGFDYLGEPTPYNQDQTNALNFADPKERAKAMEDLKRLGNRAPSRSSYFGIIDLAGFKKDRFYLYQARWRPEMPMAHILPHWNWEDRKGEVTPVHVYTSGDEAELFLNGKSLGKRQKGKPSAYRIVWDDVKYQPGTLEVVVTKDGKPWTKATMETTGAAAKLQLTADRAKIASDGQDLSYLTIRVVDAKGREVPKTRTPVYVRVSGPLQIVGICNGDPTDLTTMKPTDPTKAEIVAFNGLAQIVVAAKRGQTGEGLVEIAAEGLGVAKLPVTADK